MHMHSLDLKKYHELKSSKLCCTIVHFPSPDSHHSNGILAGSHVTANARKLCRGLGGQSQRYPAPTVIAISNSTSSHHHVSSA
ncbi:hypothetical protein VTI28DRAFT_10633 [Corynascus sepedonium]